MILYCIFLSWIKLYFLEFCVTIIRNLCMNPFMPTVAFNICCLRETASLGIMGAPRVPPLCRETQSLGQQMLNATVGINGLTTFHAFTHRYHKIDSNNVIFNFSDKVLTRDQKEDLSMGLKLCFQPSELMYGSTLLNSNSWSTNYHSVRSIIFSLMLSNTSNLVSNQKFLNILRRFFLASRDESIIVTTPEKGNGVVILNKDSYVEMMSDFGW